MQPFFTMTEIRGGDQMGQNNLFEVASALNFEWDTILAKLPPEINLLQFFGQFDLKPLGSGDVASNLRYKHDSEINNNVVKNMMNLFSCYKKPDGYTQPVVITSVSRSERFITCQLLEDGLVNMTNNVTKESLPKETKLFNDFLDSMSVTKEKMVVFREASKGSRYNTYLADMLSFIYLMDYQFHPEAFEDKYKEPRVYNTSQMDENGLPLLKSFDKDGKTWTPKDNFDYLYFDESDQSSGINFKIPGSDSIHKVYHQLNELISLEENGAKEMVRTLLGNIGIYERFSDYWVNDVDDAFTILMIYNAYKHIQLNERDQKIKEQLEQIIKEIM